ncbi:Outer membrane autotransporter barrel domain protein, partial [Yersinia kristensenii ATCC 33638]
MLLVSVAFEAPVTCNIPLPVTVLPKVPLKPLSA